MSEQMSLESFISFFDKEETCMKALFGMRWPEGFQCPRCRHTRAYVISTRKLPLFECQACKTQTSLIAGTVMEGSRTSLRRWFQAIFLHAQPQSVNAVQLSQIIGVTYKTAWLICHKLRHAMSQAESNELLKGLVRVSEAIYARRMVPHFSWEKQEQPLLIGASEDENGAITRVKIEQQSKETIQSRYTPFAVDRFIRRHVEPDAATGTIVSRRMGRGLNRSLFHIAQNAEQWLACLFRGIGCKHLQAYLDQYCFTINNKKSLLQKLFQSCMVSRTITYSTLTGRSSKLRLSHNPPYKIAS